MRPSRRAVLLGAGVLGGGLMVGVGGLVGALALHDRRAHQREALDGGAPLVALWIRIATDETITVLSPHAEMGQGSNTGLMQIAADELDADWAQMRVEPAPAHTGFANGALVEGFFAGDAPAGPWRARLTSNAAGWVADAMNIQITGGSASIRFTGWRSVRWAAAAARELLVAAAAESLGVPPSELATDRGRVVHAGSGRALTYGALAERAAEFDLPSTPTFREASARRYVGQRIPREDLPAKVFATAEYGIDVHVPGMKYAAVKHTPVIGAAVTAITNEAELLARRGVSSVHVVPEGVAVVADNPWRAEQAARAATFTHAVVPHAGATTASLLAEQQAALDGPLEVVVERGEPLGADAVAAEYAVPYLAHAGMEPLAATVWRADGQVHVAFGTQDPLGARAHVADTLGIPAHEVVIHPKIMGGGFGRRVGAAGGADGYNWLTETLEVFRATGEPVKLTWSREEDLRAGRYRPLTYARLRGAVGDDGLPRAWEGRFYGRAEDTEAALPALYEIPNLDVRHVDAAQFVPFAYWRSVEYSNHSFFVESFVDELARAAGGDPVDVRLRMLARSTHREARRARGVLERAAALAGWGGTPTPGRALGVGLVASFGSVVAEVAEVSLEGGAPRVHRVWCAVDCGVAVNPDSVEAQVQGGVVFGLTAALFGRIDIANGGVVQSNFHDYRMVRMSEAPQVTVAIVDSGGPVGGAGEVGVPPIAPAVANALAALGPRPRRLPLT